MADQGPATDLLGVSQPARDIGPWKRERNRRQARSMFKGGGFGHVDRHELAGRQGRPPSAVEYRYGFGKGNDDLEVGCAIRCDVRTRALKRLSLPVEFYNLKTVTSQSRNLSRV